MLDSKPVIMALNQIIELSGRKSKFGLYSYFTDFNKLWSVSESNSFDDFIASLENLEDIVIIWDDIPSGNTASVNTSLYLTPIDWAVAFSLAACKHIKPNFRITIIDLNSDSSASAPAVRFVNHFPKRDIMSMPWVRLIRPIYCAMDKDGHETDERNIEDVIIELITGPVAESKFKTISQTYILDNSHDIDVVRSVWRTNLVKTSNPDDNHAIANLVGPMLLCPNSVNPSPSVSALQKLLSTLGLYTTEIPQKISSDIKNKWQNLYNRLTKNKVKILLLDDQWKDGWGSALCGLLGCEYEPQSDQESSSNFVRISSSKDKLVIKACNNPVWLYDFLKNKLNEHRFKLNLDSETPDDCMEILCLDLRLFSGNKLESEISFIEQLRIIAEEQNRLGTPEWKEYDDLVNIKTWVNDVRNGKLAYDQAKKHSGYFNALSLLPRIIANIDPSYPVIIFSSTGRREIVKCFTEFENILSIFEKPRFDEQFRPEMVIESGWNLRKMFKSAVNILEVKKILRSIKSIKINNLFGCIENEHAHVELFIDEYHPDNKEKDEDIKRNNIWIGGCFALFAGADKVNAIKKADEFDDALVTNGYFYYSRGPFEPNIGIHTVKAKNNPAITELEKTLTSISKPVLIEPLRLKNRTDVNNTDDNIGDYAYRTSLKLLLEYFIYEMLPRIQSETKAKSISYSIYAGARVSAHSDEAHARHIFYRNGLTAWKPDQNSKKFLVDSLDNSTIFTILDDLLTRRKSKYELERAIGTNMIYDMDHNNNFTPKLRPGKAGLVYCRSCRVTFELKLSDGNKKFIRWDENKKKNWTFNCPLCIELKTVRPDYRGGLYIADQLVSVQDFNSGLYDKIINITQWGFDEEIDDYVREIIMVGNLVDRSDLVGGVIKAAAVMKRNPNCINSKIISSILARIAPELDKLHAKPFHELVKVLTENIESSDLPIGRQQITVISKNGNIVKCRNSCGETVKITIDEYNRTQKNVRDKMTPSSSLWATLYQDNDILIARQITLNKDYDASTNDMNDNTPLAQKESLLDMYLKSA